MIQVTRQGRGPRMLGMMGVILGSAIGFGAIKSPTIFGGQAIVACTVAILIVATLGAICSAPRAFWAGLAVVGWASMLFVADTWDDRNGTYFLPAALYHRYDPIGFEKSVRRFEFGMPQYRKIVYTQLAIAQGILGGLIAVGFAGRSWNCGKVIHEIGGLLTSLSILGILIGFFCLQSRFSDPLWMVATTQAVAICLTASLLGSVVGNRRTFARGFAALGWAAALMLAYARSSNENPPWSPEDQWIEGYYSALDLTGSWHSICRVVYRSWFHVASNPLTVLAAGILGGLLACRFESRRWRDRVPCKS